MGSIWGAHPFQVIDFQTSYHILLARPWIHRNKAMPSTYHQCLKAVWKGKRVHINATESPFQRDKAYFLEAIYFDELAEAREAAPSRSKGVRFSRWEDLEGGDPKSITLSTPRRVGQRRVDQTTRRTRDLDKRATSLKKSASSMDGRYIFYEGFQGHIRL